MTNSILPDDSAPADDSPSPWRPAPKPPADLSPAQRTAADRARDIAMGRAEPTPTERHHIRQQTAEVRNRVQRHRNYRIGDEAKLQALEDAAP